MMSGPYHDWRDDNTSESVANERIAAAIAASSASGHNHLHRALNVPRTETKYSETRSCDECGNVSSKKLQKCSKCESAFYCGCPCQLKAWKSSHKQMCPTLKKVCETDAAEVVQHLSNASLSVFSRFRDLERLDRHLPFELAVHKHGLFDVLRDLLVQEVSQVRARYSSGQCCSALQMICTIFRGQRRKVASGVFTTMDRSRVSAFMMSHNFGWKAWLDAAVATAAVPLRSMSVKKKD